MHEPYSKNPNFSGSLFRDIGVSGASAEGGSIDESRMKVEFGGFGALAGAQVETISVKNGELSITHLDGKSQRYTKIK